MDYQAAEMRLLCVLRYAVHERSTEAPVSADGSAMLGMHLCRWMWGVWVHLQYVCIRLEMWQQTKYEVVLYERVLHLVVY